MGSSPPRLVVSDRSLTSDAASAAVRPARPYATPAPANVALNNNLLQMGKLSNIVEECVPIHVGCLHVSSQLVVVTKVPEVYDDVGDNANAVAGGGGVRQSRGNTPEYEVTNLPLEAEVCS